MKIQNITSKQVNTKFGMKPTYSVQADGEWYSYGFKKPSFAIGDEVMFTFTEGTYGKQIDAGSARVVSSGGGSSSVDTPASSGGSSAPSGGRSYGPPVKPFPIPPLHGDRAIIRQNSVTNAVNVLREDAAFEALLLEKKADAVITLARMFEAYSSGDMDLEQAKKELGNA